jgi:hypothetical protein
MLVEALFWFHPMVWWIGGRLVEERERACDEEVVRSGHDRETYARSLVECCRLFLQSPLRCVAGASGSNLSRRVEMIMTSPLRPSLSRPAKSVLVTAGICAAATPVAAGWLTTPMVGRAVTVVAAIASAPANTLLQAAATTSAPDRNEAPIPVAPAPAIAAPSAPVQRIATLRREPLQLDTDADDQPALGLAATLSSATNSRLPEAQLVPVADTEPPRVTAPLGPGHYVQRSGLKSTGGCRDGGGAIPVYRMVTPLIAPGHVITNFRFDLVGDTRCREGNEFPAYASPSASCELRTDRPDSKTVWFSLYTDLNYCSDGQRPPRQDDKSIRRAAMVFTYDVQ